MAEAGGSGHGDVADASLAAAREAATEAAALKEEKVPRAVGVSHSAVHIGFRLPTARGGPCAGA